MRRGLLARLKALFITASCGDVVQRVKSMYVQLSLISSAGQPLHQAVSHSSRKKRGRHNKKSWIEKNSRREAVSDSRGVPRCTEKILQKFYSCSHVSIVRLVQSTIFVSRDFHSHSSPLYHLPGELVSLYPCQALISICGIAHVPALSFRCHSDSHQSWLMTSLEVSEIPNLEWKRISCECVSSYDLLLVSLPLRVLCCCLLSRVSGMIVQSFSVLLVRKSTQLTVHQEHTFLTLHWTRQQSPDLDIHSSREIDQRNTVYKICASSSLDHQPSQRLNIPWCVSRSCSSHLVSMQVSSGRDSVLVFLSNISTLLWHMSNLQVLVTQVCMTSILSQLSDNCSEQWVLNLITRCRLIMRIQTLLFRRRRHHCLCVLQLNNVQAFVNVLGNRFHRESSAVAIVYTSVLES